MNVDENVKSIVLGRLKAVEEKYAVRLIYACESGSRAWGFPSADSDYDVRFLYLHPTDWYLSINRGRDVIEEPIVDDFDINGWDLQKALGLLYKSNPPLLEWLNSPIVYLEETGIANILRMVSKKFYSPTNCFSYYLQKAKGTLTDYLKGGQVLTKKYFYVLRPVLAMQWIEQGLGIIPTDFNVLVQHLIKDPILLADIQALLQHKRAETELGSGPRIESISAFIESEMDRLSEVDPAKSERPNIAALDAVFRDSLKECWG
jgi:predicted nucleotidyltransferase